MEEKQQEGMLKEGTEKRRGGMKEGKEKERGGKTDGWKKIEKSEWER